MQKNWYREMTCSYNAGDVSQREVSHYQSIKPIMKGGLSSDIAADGTIAITKDLFSIRMHGLLTSTVKINFIV